jgi:hypothetical protein
VAEASQAHWQALLSRLGKGAARQLQVIVGDPSLLGGDVPPDARAAWQAKQKAIYLFDQAFRNGNAGAAEVLARLGRFGGVKVVSA